ncbi:cyclic nucleotide-binding domain-containing protein [Falsihalocynthiibacter sp. S25ZX9]|uniref:cyclic nucleotide-binding domain-containing protein n=1 Tax=Falsihalocynthiibacter sp. S25ZX9 TaxID=3240870 RepID=UPI00350F1585
MEDLLLTDYLVFAAAGMFVFGYLVINQVVLRTMLLIGTVLYIWYYAIVDSTPLWPAIWASVATGTANTLGLLGLMYRRSARAIPKEFRDIYLHFNNLPPGDFRKLMRATSRVVRPAGFKLTTAGTKVATLYYILDGEAHIEKRNGSFSIPQNSFIGEVSFLTGNSASGTAVLSRESTVLEWNVNVLKRHAARDQRFRLALDALISLDLARKVSQSVLSDKFELVSARPV